MLVVLCRMSRWGVYNNASRFCQGIDFRAIGQSRLGARLGYGQGRRGAGPDDGSGQRNRSARAVARRPVEGVAGPPCQQRAPSGAPSL